MALDRLFKMAGFIAVAALPAGSNLLLTLVLVRTLDVPAFANWSIIEPLLLIFAAMAALGMQYGVLFTSAREAADPRKALGTGIMVAAPVALILALLVWLGLAAFGIAIALPSVVLPLVADTIGLLIVSSLRGQRRMGIWLIFEGLRSLLLVVVAFAAMHYARNLVSSVESFMLLRGTITAIAVIATALILRARFSFDGPLVLRMVKYGLPISLSALVALFTSSADRFLMGAFQIDAATIASYAAHQRLTGLLVVFTVTPLNLWFAVEAIRRDTVAQASFFQGVVVALLGGLSVLVLAAFVGGPLVWPYLFPGLEFHPIVYALLGLSIVPQAMAIVLNVGGLFEKRTHLNAIVVAATATTVLVVGGALVPVLSGVGAAVARFASYIAQAISGRAISQHIAPIHHRFLPLLPFLAAIATATLTLFAEPTHVPEWLSAIAALALVGVGVWTNRANLAQVVSRVPAPAAKETASSPASPD